MLSGNRVASWRVSGGANPTRVIPNCVSTFQHLLFGSLCQWGYLGLSESTIYLGLALFAGGSVCQGSGAAWSYHAHLELERSCEASFMATLGYYGDLGPPLIGNILGSRALGRSGPLWALLVWTL